MRDCECNIAYIRFRVKSAGFHPSPNAAMASHMRVEPVLRALCRYRTERYNPRMAGSTDCEPDTPRRSAFAAVSPGILIAATGVGAGDLMTASLGGSAVGLSIVWAAAAGGALKWFLNEGIARWQMATGTTLLEGWFERLGAWVRWVFIVYFLVWTFVTAGALVNACGVAGVAILRLDDVALVRWFAVGVHARLGIDAPLTPDAISKIAWGVIHSMVGLGLVWFGGYKLFERFMGVCIAVMFVTVMTTACLILPTLGGESAGVPPPTADAGGALKWILALLGGVGGTVTLLSYGYWIREAGRSGATGLRACRLDLTLGYAMTALFGMAMVLIGSRVEISGSGASVAIDLSRQLEQILGRPGAWVFRIGFWGAVFSSLLGVWQGVPYLFADFTSQLRRAPDADRRRLDFAPRPRWPLDPDAPKAAFAGIKA